MTAPILYSFRRCPYAMRARLALHAAGVACELRETALRDKPAELLAASPKGTVPVLVLEGGEVIEESLDIMAWALEKDDPEGWMNAPEGEVANWTKAIDGTFKHHLDRYKYPDRFEGVDAETHFAGGVAILAEMDRAISGSGHLVGGRESLADIAAFPFIRQFANAGREVFDALALPHLQAWLARHLSSARFEAIMQKHAVWKRGRGPLVFSRQSDHKAPSATSGRGDGV